MSTEDRKVRIDLKRSTRRRLAARAQKRETWDEALTRLMDEADMYAKGVVTLHI